MPKPLLFLDIEGVICVRDAFGAEGYVTIGGATRSLAPDIGNKLRELSESFEPVWASSWGDVANEELGPALGLPPLAHVTFEADAELPGHYKLKGIQTFVQDRAAAWVDDGMTGDCYAWARTRRSPTLLLETEPQVGITWDQVDDLLAFAQRGSPTL